MKTLNEIHINIFLDCLLSCDGNKQAAIQRAFKEFNLNAWGSVASWLFSIEIWGME